MIKAGIAMSPLSKKQQMPREKQLDRGAEAEELVEWHLEGKLEVHQRKYRIGGAKLEADVSWARSTGAAGVMSPVGTRPVVVDVAEWA